jgi:hypothetical protein
MWWMMHRVLTFLLDTFGQGFNHECKPAIGGPVRGYAPCQLLQGILLRVR